MTDARRGEFWHRAGPVAAVGLLLLGATTEACGGGDTGTGGMGGAGGSTGPQMGGNNPGGNGPGASGPGGSGPGGGGSSGTAGGGAGSLTAKQVASDPATFTNPFDATPDTAGTNIYFTGVDATGLPAVFKVKSSGGAITKVASGDPLVAPFNIATGGTGDELYVADPGAEQATDRGVIWKMGTGSGETPTAVSGSDGLAVRGLVINVESSADQLYFTGVDDSSGAANVYKLKASGGTATALIANGNTLVDPSGVAIAGNGDIYVADTVGGSDREAQIVKIHSGAAAVWVTGIKVNYPAGLALTNDDATLMVSSLVPSAGSDQIIQISTATKTQKPFTMSGTVDLSKLIEAGGMHRGITNNIFAWVDGSAGAMNTGAVYLLQFK